MKKKLSVLTLLTATSLSMTTPVFATSDTFSSQEPSQILYHGLSVEEARERFAQEYPGQEFKLEYVANGLGGMTIPSEESNSQILYHGISVEEARERFAQEYPGQEFKLEYVANGLGGMNLSEASLTTGDTAITSENQPLSEIPVIEEGLEVTTSVSGSSNKLTTSESGIKVLPKTSDATSMLAVFGVLMSLLGLVGLKKRSN